MNKHVSSATTSSWQESAVTVMLAEDDGNARDGLDHRGPSVSGDTSDQWSVSCLLSQRKTEKERANAAHSVLLR